MPTGTRIVLFLTLFTPDFIFQYAFAAKITSESPSTRDLFSFIKSPVLSSKQSKKSKWEIEI